MEKNNKINLMKFDQVVIDVPKFIEVPGKKWVSYGINNLYPNFLVDLFQDSAMNNTAITSKVDAVVGQGLETQSEETNYVLKRANPKESWNDVFAKCAFDYVLFGGFALNIIWDRSGENIAEFYHVDMSKLRSGHINPETDEVDEYYYSHCWREYRKYKPICYPSFDPSKAIEAPSQIYYYFNYSPNNQYYPLPSYQGGLKDIQIDVETSRFHLANLANGLNPSLFIEMANGVPAPEERENIYRDLQDTFGGTRNAGRFFLSFAADKDHATSVTPIQSANDNYYISLDAWVTTRVLSAHRITSPLLLGIKDGGSSLGSNKDEIMVAYEHFLTTVVRPYTQAMIKVFDNLMFYKGYPDIELSVKPNQLFKIENAETTGTV